MTFLAWPLGLLFGGGAPLTTILAAYWMFARTVERSAASFGLSRSSVAGAASTIVAAAAVSGRSAAVIPHWRVMVAHPLDLLRITDAFSMSFGLIGGFGALILVARRERLPLGTLLDVFVLALPLGLAVHALGCLLRNDCYGRAAAPPLGIRFPGLQVPRYPVELYAAVAGLLLFAVLRHINPRRRRTGLLAAAGLAAMATTGLALDSLRLSTGDHVTRNVNLVLFALAGGIALIFGQRAIRLKEPAAIVSGPPYSVDQVFTRSANAFKRIGD